LVLEKWVVIPPIRKIELTLSVVFETLTSRLLCFRLKIADVSLGEWGYVVQMG
jgi:hypothetical protein